MHNLSRRVAWVAVMAALVAVMVLSASNSAVADPILIDFQPGSGTTQSGFTAIQSLDPTTVGGVTFDLGGAVLFDRNPGFTNSSPFTFEDLLDDFAFANAGGGATTAPAITLAITGLFASTAYDLRMYSADFFLPAGGVWADRVETTYTTTVGTGSIFTSTFDRTMNPTNNDQYSGFGTITSSALGEITLSVQGTSKDGGQAYTRLNGLTLQVVPEPSTLLLLGTGLAAVGIRRYRKRT